MPRGLTLTPKFQVFDPVVTLRRIFMMDLFITPKPSPQMLLHNQTMFQHPSVFTDSTRSSDEMVSRRIGPSAAPKTRCPRHSRSPLPWGSFYRSPALDFAHAPTTGAACHSSGWLPAPQITLGTPRVIAHMVQLIAAVTFIGRLVGSDSAVITFSTDQRRECVHVKILL